MKELLNFIHKGRDLNVFPIINSRSFVSSSKLSSHAIYWDINCLCGWSDECESFVNHPRRIVWRFFRIDCRFVTQVIIPGRDSNVEHYFPPPGGSLLSCEGIGWRGGEEDTQRDHIHQTTNSIYGLTLYHMVNESSDSCQVIQMVISNWDRW